MSDILTRLALQKRQEAGVKSNLLVMLLSKPCQFVSCIPDGWVRYVHVDLPPGEAWLDPEREIRPALENLVGHLVATGRTAIDYCAVKNNDVRSIVIKTAPEST